MIDNIQEIRNRVTMSDVLNMYSNVKIEKGRCQCPLHNGIDNNFKIYNNKTFNCWVCHKGGDVINFVSYLFDISCSEAIKQIDKDFNLSLFETLDTEEYIKRQKEYKSKLKAEEKKKKDIEKCLSDIYRLCAIHRKCHFLIKDFKGGEMDKKTEFAFNKIEYIKYLIEEKEKELESLKEE